MANKIRSIELERGVVVDFLPKGLLELKDENNSVVISTSDLEAIRDTVRQNSKANGVIQPEKEKV